MSRNKARSKDGKVAGYILRDGAFVSKKELDIRALKKIAQDIPQSEKDLRSKRKKVKKQTQALPGMKETGLGREIMPLYNPDQLIRLAESNTYHRRCAKQIASDVAGLGWRLEPKAGMNLEDLDGTQKTEAKEERKRLEEFLSHPNPLQTLREIFEAGQYDFGLIGWQAYEVVRDRLLSADNTNYELADPKEFYHIEGHTLRIIKPDAGQPIKFVQKRGRKKTYFMPIGAVKKNGKPWKLNRKTGKYEDNITANMLANELIFIRDYSPRDSYYGVPGIITALGAILGAIGVRDYNLKFFENHAVPEYAVIVSGSELDDEVIALIKRYFTEEIKGEAHSTLVLTLPGTKEEIEIKFERLTVEVREGSFRIYSESNRNEIIDAHGIPPHRVMAMKAGALAGNYAREATEIYKQSVVEPRQEVLERRLNNQVLGGKYWQFKFMDLDTRDITQEIKNSQILFGLGSITPNQIREAMGREPQEDGDGYYISKQYVPLSEAGALTKMSKSRGEDEEAQRELLAAIRELRQVATKAIEG